MSLSTTKQSESSAHPNPRRLEWAAFVPQSELSSDDATISHIETCDLCAEKIHALRLGRAAFLKENPPSAFLDAVEARAESVRNAKTLSFRTWAVIGLAASVVLCLAVLFLANPTKKPAAEQAGDFPGISLKGGSAPVVSMALFVSRGGADALPWNQRDALHQGDVLKFGVKSAMDGYLMIANMDDRGRVSLYNPLNNADPAWVSKGKLTLIKDSILLDDFVGKEVIAVFVSKTSLDFASVKEALEASYRKANGNLGRIAVTGIEAEISLTHITKAAQ
jgi:hypothetical protein